MEILITTLLVPTLGALLLAAEWQSRVAFGRATRAHWRRGLQFLAGLLVLLGAGFVLHGAARLFTRFSAEQLILTIFRAALVYLLVRAAQFALRVARLPDPYSVSTDASPSPPSIRGPVRDELREYAWLLTGFPVLWVAIPILLFVSPALFGVALAGIVRRAERARFVSMLAIATDHNLDLADEVDVFATGLRPWRRERYVALAGRLRDGIALSEALAADRRLLSPPVVAAIRVGEQVGNVRQVLRETARRELDAVARPQFSSSIASLLCYYWFVLLALCCASAYLGFWVSPKLQAICEDYGLEPPWLFQRLSDWSTGSAEFLLLVVPLLMLPVVGLLLLATRSVDPSDSALETPVARWFPRTDTPGMLRWLSFAVAAARPLPALLNTIGESYPERATAARLLRAGEAMDGGSDPWQALAGEGFLSRREADAVRVAERAGSAHLALQALADSIERTRMRRMLRWVEWLRPVVMLVFAGLVAVFCLAYFLPLVRLLEHVMQRWL